MQLLQVQHKHSFSLRQMGIILVLLPFVIALVLILVLTNMLHSSEMNVAYQEQNEELMSEARRIPTLFQDSGSLLTGYILTRNKMFLKRFEHFEIEIPQHLSRLEFLFKDRPAGARHISNVATMVHDGLQALSKAKEVAVQGDQHDPSFVPQLMRTYDALRVVHRSLVHELNDLVDESKGVETTSWIPSSARQWLDVVLAIALLLSIVSTLLLARFFSTRLERRLQVLVNNSYRLASGAALLPRLSGDDEIAELDGVFHHMADALSEASRKEKAIIAHTADVISCLNGDGTFALVSAACWQIWGYEPEELVGKHCLTVIARDDHQVTEGSIDQAMKSKSPVSFENRVCRKDGALVETLWNAHWSESEKLCICVAHDISERKEVERIKQEFVSIVSHDLRTPLTSICCGLELMSKGVVGNIDAEACAELRKLEEHAERLVKLTEDLLSIEKLDQGKLQLAIEQHSLEDIIYQAVYSTAASARQRGVRLVPLVADLTLLCDADRLIQVLTNLLSNAVKFSPPQSEVTIALESVDGFVEVQVIDHGPGIDEKYQQAIFDRYVQAPDTPKGGFGLGLAICRMMIEAHKGTIGVKPTPGGGATFWFRLPLSQ